MTSLIGKDEPSKAECYAKHIKNWQESDMPQKEYCKSNNISYPTFVYWRIKLRGKSKKLSLKEQPTFVPVSPQLPTASIKPTVAPSMHQTITITLPNGIQLSFPLTTNPTSLGEYMKAIRAVL